MILESMDTSEHMPPVDPLTKSLPAYSKGTVVYIPSNEEKGKVSIRRLFVAAQIPNPMDKDNPLIGLSPKPNGLEPDVMVYKNYKASSLAGISFTVGQEIPVQRSPKTEETEGKIETSGWVIRAINDSTPQNPSVTVEHPIHGKKLIPMSILHALREKFAASSTDKSVSLVGSGDHKTPAEAMVPAAKPEGSSLDLVRAKIAAEEKPTSSEESQKTKAHQYAETIRRKGTIIRYQKIIGRETSTLQAVASYEKGGALNQRGYKGPSRLHALLTNPEDELYPFINEIIDHIASSADHLVLLPAIGDDEPTINLVYINSSTSTEMAWKSPVIFGFELPRQEGNHLLEAIQTDPELMRSVISNYAGTNSVAKGQDRTLNITQFAPNKAVPSWNLFKKPKVNKWNQSTQELPYITSALI